MAPRSSFKDEFTHCSLGQYLRGSVLQSSPQAEKAGRCELGSGACSRTKLCSVLGTVHADICSTVAGPRCCTMESIGD